MKPGRNDPCPCGSGNKYKRCCGLEPAAAPSRMPDNNEIGALVALVGQERLSEAEHKARTLLNRFPQAGMLWKVLGVALMRQGKDALPALRRTAELMPRDAEAHGNLGAALHDRGQWEEALASLRVALEMRPNDIEALVDAADALRALGRIRESIGLYQRALERDARQLGAHNNLGNAFVELGQYEDALGCYRRALEIKPDDAQVLRNLGSAHYKLGNALFDARKMDAAAASYRRVLAIEPGQAAAHLGLAVVLRAQRRPAEAEASCQAALAIDPRYVEAVSMLGELRADRGDFAEAEQLFRRALAIDPNFAFAYSGIATHRKMTLADTEWLTGAEALLAKRAPLEDEITLRYALGKYFDDVGEYHRAFEHYQAANVLGIRHGSKYDAAKLTERVDDVIRSFGAGFMHDVHASAFDSERPVFVIGMPRSGTSLTEQILASHPAVFGAGEVAFWDGAFNTWQAAKRAGTAHPGLLTNFAHGYLDRVVPSSGAASRIIDKMPANFLYAGLIHAAFPRARIIHMRRHPIDTCLSIYFQNFFNRDPYANDFDSLVHYYGEYVRVTDHWRAVLPAAAFLEVPYESLIEDQEGWTRRMLDFIALPWDPRCLEFHRTERVVITASKWQVRQKINSSSAGRWRKYEAYIGPLKRLLKTDDIR